MTEEIIADYWLTHYATEHCTLCGNVGVIDTRGICTPAWVEVGRLNYCICPNGQTLREQGADFGALAQTIKRVLHGRP